MQANRLQHGVGEERAQERQREVLMQIVDAAFGRRLALTIQQMPNAATMSSRLAPAASASVAHCNAC